MLAKQYKREKRHRKVKSRTVGTAEVPRLCVFRSSNHIYAQLIDDSNSKTLLAASDAEIKSGGKSKTEKEEKKRGKTGIAFEVGKLIAKKAKEKEIQKVKFDRGGYKYHGRVKALADGAREGGIKF